MTDLRIDYDAALAAYDEHGGKHSEALRAALDAGVHLATIQMRAIEEYADERDDQRDRVIAALDDALGEGSCVERDITDAIRELAKERNDAEKRGAEKALREQAVRAERDYLEFVNALQGCRGDADYWRWNGHAEALRAVATRLRTLAGDEVPAYGSQEWREQQGIRARVTP